MYETHEPIKFCSKQCGAKYQGLKNGGENNGMFGKKPWHYGLTKDTNRMLKHCSEKYSGENHHFFGMTHSLISKQKMRETLSKSNAFQNFIKLPWMERMFNNDEEKYQKYLEKIKGQFSIDWFIVVYGI